MRTFLALLLLQPYLSFAQGVEGTITYEVKINNHRNLPPEREEMKNMIPEFSTVKMALIFNENEALYKVHDEEEDVTMENGGMRLQVRMPQTETYLNKQSMRRVRKREFMGKNYLIEDTLQVHPWKITSETRIVSGYKCRQAYYETEADGRKQTVVAWYTDQLPPYLGPEAYNTLPGAILEVDVNDGERVYIAKKLTMRSLKKNELKEPSRGQKVSEREYQALVEEQMEKMRGNRIIIRN